MTNHKFNNYQLKCLLKDRTEYWIKEYIDLCVHTGSIFNFNSALNAIISPPDGNIINDFKICLSKTPPKNKSTRLIINPTRYVFHLKPLLLSIVTSRSLIIILVFYV